MVDKYINQAPQGELTAPTGDEVLDVTDTTNDWFIAIKNLIVRKLRETAGPTTLSMGAIADGDHLIRSGSNVVGVPGVWPENLFINGNMQVAQRGTSVAGITASGYYTLDRWNLLLTTLGTWTQSQIADSPGGSGVTNCLKMLVTTADAAPAAADVCQVQYRFEGQHLQHIRKGTSSAKQLTLSFEVKSSTTGTYIAELFDNNNTRQISASYTISAANTWEKKTITFAGDTSGVLNNDANLSLIAGFFLAAGSNFTSGTLNTAWAAVTTANRAVGQTNLAATVNNYIQFTKVKLQVGPAATDPEFLPFEIELHRCKRYYQKSFIYATAPAQNIGTNTGDITGSASAGGAVTFRVFVPFEPIMRAAPTITFYNTSAANAQFRDVTAVADCSAAGSNVVETGMNAFATQPAGAAANDRISFHYTADAEL